MELSDTITQKWRRGHGRCGKGDGGVGARVIFVCPSDFESPFFSKYTNDEPLKINFRFSDPNPYITCIEFLFNNTSISYRCKGHYLPNRKFVLPVKTIRYD
jgi:hypothetical protein